MTTLEILTKARAKIAQGWCQGNYACDADGMHVPDNDPRAVCWCAIGAMWAVSNPYSVTEVDPAAVALRRGLPANTDSIVEWNDAPGQTKDEVLAAYDRAIAIFSSLPLAAGSAT